MGFAEMLADYRAHKTIESYQLDSFFIGAKNSEKNIDLWSIEGPVKLYNYFEEKGKSRIYISQYFAYIRTIAKQIGRDDVVTSIDNYMKTSGRFPGQSPDLIIQLSQKFENNLNILDKTGDVAYKEVDDIIQLGKKTATEMVQNG